ncbi:MAG TPA: sugar phosphate isomerase/epimerase [Candidatus Mediterraneibacter merdipullorum]|nr:sugar phosphate isomerase/epimerase [Candidatus Mediterraneibacter merdipullorum]
MELGLLTAILEEYSFKEAIDIASDMGFGCVEVACWPAGGAERRYAGVSHIDVERVAEDESYRRNILDYAKSKGVRISALAYYPNTMDADLEKRTANISHLKKVIKASALLGVNLTNTFIGRDQNKNLEENLKLFDEIWPDIMSYAEENGVRIGIENCPMLFGPDQWPGGQNLMSTPVIWRELFRRLPGRNFGLNFDPSHFVWQGMDYIRPIYEFKDRLFHIHFKDIKLRKDKLAECGTMAYPLDYMTPKIPGLGDVRWDEFVSALTDVGYDGPACIEVEDKAFEGSREKVLQSIAQSKKYMEQYV